MFSACKLGLPWELLALREADNQAAGSIIVTCFETSKILNLCLQSTACATKPILQTSTEVLLIFIQFKSSSFENFTPTSANHREDKMFRRSSFTSHVKVVRSLVGQKLTPESIAHCWELALLFKMRRTPWQENTVHSNYTRVTPLFSCTRIKTVA